MKIISWNVNGIIACRRKGLLKFLAVSNPDVMCLQETKAKVPLNTPGYHQIWNPAEKPGYSGTLVLTKQLPLSYSTTLGDKEMDAEGRLIALEYKDYYIVNVYTPNLNVNSAPDRYVFRMRWDEAFRRYVSSLEKPVILCGDFNVARESIDTYPTERKETERRFFPTDELGEFEKLFELGFYDVFRTFYPGKADAYTWWGPKNRAREENRGSRLDYFLVSESLLDSVKSIRHHVNVQGSDHCPISMMIRASTRKAVLSLSDTELAAMWRAINWDQVKDQVYHLQHDISKAAHYRDWPLVRKLQDEFVCHVAVKYLAVKVVSDTNSAPGIDGMRWLSDAEKGRAVATLSPVNYTPLPYRVQEIQDRKNKIISVTIPVIRDKAMQAMYAMALDPVAEATADHMSFFSRKGRSEKDLHAYLEHDLSAPGAPEWAYIVDIEAFYGNIIYRVLLERIPMDTSMLKKFLTAGIIQYGELFQPDRGISKAGSLSPILGNMLLDGLQTHIYDNLYPDGNVDYPNGKMYRFCDDIYISARSEAEARKIEDITSSFFAERGLRPNREKTHIINIRNGFDFLSRHYQLRDGMLYVTPSDGSVEEEKRKLADLILNWNGTMRGLITAINRQLRGWQTYHAVEDAYWANRAIDVYVEGLLVRRMCDRYPHWSRQAVLKNFWISDGQDRIFALPRDPTCRVMLLAPTGIKRYKPCKSSFNPYLDKAYYEWLKERRNILRHSSKYQAVWRRQEGRCAYCNQPMLPDEEVDVVEKELGEGRSARNLLYVHQRCIYRISHNGQVPASSIDFFEMLDDILDSAPTSESPYQELTAFFHRSSKTPLSLTFQEIEAILGDSLDWEAYFYEAFWYDSVPGTITPMWKEEGFPLHFFLRTTPNYCISDSWTSQGYRIKALHLAEERVVFRRIEDRTSALQIPRALRAKKLPDAAVHEAKEFFKYLIQKYAL